MFQVLQGPPGMDPCHPDIECRTFDIESHIRCRLGRLQVRYDMTSSFKVLIPKNTSNLKCSLNSIKIRCTNVVPSASIWQPQAECTVVPGRVHFQVVGRAALKLNLGRVGGWLEGEARRSSTGKVAHSSSHSRAGFGSWSRFARDCH
jgi:hypothetical protein